MLGYPYKIKDYSRDELDSLEEQMEKKVIEFSKTSKHVNVFFFS